VKSFKVGILSDPHRKTKLHKEAILHLKEVGANYLLHLGDLVVEDNLKLLESASLPYRAVFGNNDSALKSLSGYQIFAEPYYLKIKDITFKMMHLPYYLTPDSDVVLFGHTHQFACEFKNNTLYLNPGEVCAREKPISEHTLLEVDNKSFKVIYYYKEPNQSQWQSREFNFKRSNE